MIIPNVGLENQIYFEQIKKVAIVCRAINNKIRKRILIQLEVKFKLSVTDIYIDLGISQSTTSIHLAILRRTGIVKTTREGNKIYYELNHSKLLEIKKFAELLQNK